jgi:hypothetical protein
MTQSGPSRLSLPDAVRANGSHEMAATSGTISDSSRLGGLFVAEARPAGVSRLRRQLSEVASRSDVRTTVSAPSIGPLPETFDVRIVTEYPRRARYLVMPETRRAATTNEGGENCATSRIERPLRVTG